jgi:polyisoprenoid-binding protein YceI
MAPMRRGVLWLALTLAVILGSAWSGVASVAAARSAPTAPRVAHADPPSALIGTWKAATGSHTGYTVTTNVFLAGTQTITGRTTAVTGSATVRLVSGRERLTAARFSADMRRATTGNAIFDQQAAETFETGRYPTGVFVLVTPVYLPSAASIAKGTTLSLTGNLTLHGVTRRVTVKARSIGNARRFTVSGVLPIRLSDYGVPLVSAGGLARTNDSATVDFKVVFVR